MRVLLLPLLTVAACDPFSPDLGESPFRCGDADPACPSGYECVEYSPAQKVCERSGEDPGDPDGGSNPIECDDDSDVEGQNGNDTVNTAWVTPIPNSMPTLSLVRLSICPSDDQDHYRFGVNENGKNIHVTITSQVSDGKLGLQILEGQGDVIANGAVTDGTTIEVAVNNLSIGDYFVKVFAHPDEPDAQNNYSLDIVTCGPVGGPCAD
jgi:hypothetical protein